MLGDEARELLGFPSNSHPTLTEVKAAYKRKALEFHPDRFPIHEKSHAESKFKMISEAYSCLQVQLGKGLQSSGHGNICLFVCLLWTTFVLSSSSSSMKPYLFYLGTYTQVVRTGIPRVYRGRSNHALASVPFFVLILGTLSLGGFNASRAYQRQKESYPSHNPFLP